MLIYEYIYQGATDTQASGTQLTVQQASNILSNLIAAGGDTASAQSVRVYPLFRWLGQLSYIILTKCVMFPCPLQVSQWGTLLANGAAEVDQFLNSPSGNVVKSYVNTTAYGNDLNKFQTSAASLGKK